MSKRHVQRFLGMLLALLLDAVANSAFAQSDAASSLRPNIVYILADDK